MATHTMQDEQAPIINMKTVGETFKGWITGKHPGKYGILYDGFDMNKNPVSIQPNTDLSSKLERVPTGCLIKITLKERVPIGDNNDYKKFTVEYDDDPKFSWDAAKSKNMGVF